MHALFRRLIPIAVVLMLLTPVAVFAQTETAARLVELVFSDDESSVTIEDTIQSVAEVTFTHDGKTYVMKVPVTIDVDSTIPLADSTLTVDAASRVGVFAIEILSVTEPEEVERGYTTVVPSDDENKLVAVSFRLTNLDDKPQQLHWIGDLIGIDDMGREFEVTELLGDDSSVCEEVNPGGTTECLAVFDVDEDVEIVNLEFYVQDERVLPLPDVEETEEDD